MVSTVDNAVSDLDLFSPAQVADPFAVLDELRETAPAVYMRKHDFWLLTRYDDVRRVTADWQGFSSAAGVGLLPEFNALHAGSVLGSDPPKHDELRAVLSERLAPRALNKLRADIGERADRLVGDLVSRRSFDAVSDLARVFPVSVVADLVGLPEEGRERLYPGADAMFTTFGPATDYIEQRRPAMVSFHELVVEMTRRGRLAEGSWGALVLDAVDDGRLSEQDGLKSISAYLTAGMDTTVNSISAMMRLFAERPDVWDQLRAEPALTPALFEEVLRLEAPVQGFFRETTRDVDVDGTAIPAGSRVMLHWAAANRDPRHYSDPAAFDIRRNPIDHLTFGYGTHACAGQGLARIEAHKLIEAMLKRVQRFELADRVTRHYNPVIRSLETVPVTVTAVGG